MARITMAQAVGELKQMFPSFDNEVLGGILQANNMNMEVTIENLIAMGGLDGEPASSDRSGSPQPFPAPAPAPTPAPPVGAPVAAPAYMDQSRIQHTKSNGSSNPKYRGKKTNLPQDFLRPPTSVQQDLSADEQLALMMLREEVMMNDRGRSAVRRTQGQASTATGNPDEIPDLGIMKGISAIGDMAKKNYEYYSKKWNAPDEVSEREMRPYDAEGRSLIANASDDDNDDDAEVISFDTPVNRRHTLDTQPLGAGSRSASSRPSNKKDA